MRGLQVCRTSPPLVFLGFVVCPLPSCSSALSYVPFLLLAENPKTLRNVRVYFEVCRMSPPFVLVGFDERSTGLSYALSLRALRVCRMPPFVLVGLVVCPLPSCSYGLMKGLQIRRMSLPFALLGFVVCPLPSCSSVLSHASCLRACFPQTEGRTKSVGPD